MCIGFMVVELFTFLYTYFHYVYIYVCVYLLQDIYLPPSIGVASVFFQHAQLV